MALGDTYYFDARVYAIDTTTTPYTATVVIDQKRFYVPYADYSNPPSSTGYLVRNGVPQQLYYDCLEWMVDLNKLTGLSIRTLNAVAANAFPEISINTSNTGDKWAIENIRTGACLALIGRSPSPVYASINDLLNDRNQIATVNSYDAFTVKNDGSGDTTGRFSGIYYSALGDSGPSVFRWCNINGVRSASNSMMVLNFYSNVDYGLAYLVGNTPVAPPDDPYAPGGYSEIGGGDGTFDDDSDLISDSSLPTVSFADTGFTRIYNPTLAQLNALANYLWTDQTFLQTVINHLKQLLENPMDAIISLSLVPCAVPNGATENVKVMFIDTGVGMNPATTQFVDVDCGTLDVEEYYGSALDYNPYTKIHAYLPYIGQVTLDTDEVMGRTLQVKYRIDIVTGMCAAKILVDQNVLYQFSGHCAINMPINSADFSSYIGAAITAGKMVAGVVAGAAGAGATAAALIGGPSPSSSLSTTQTNTDRRSPEGELKGITDTTTVHTNRTSGMTMGEMSTRALSNTVSSVMSSKMTVEHAGGFSGNSGYLAVRRPYLIIERPRMCNPEEYGKYNGRPSMIYLNLGELTGYTEVQNIQLTGFTATNPEMSEIAQLLKSGVIL